jgi:hypothetical protein
MRLHPFLSNGLEQTLRAESPTSHCISARDRDPIIQQSESFASTLVHGKEVTHSLLPALSISTFARRCLHIVFHLVAYFWMP